MPLTAQEQEELKALEAELGSATPPVSNLTPEETAELKALEDEFSADEARIAAIRNHPVTATNRADAVRNNGVREEAINNGMTLEQYQKLLAGEYPALSPEQIRYRDESAIENAKPNVVEDTIMGGASGALNAIGNTVAVVRGAPGSAVDHFMAPDINDFMDQYDPASYAGWSEADKIALYNQEMAKANKPTYEDQLSGWETIGGNLNRWKDLSSGTVAEYRPESIPGKVAEFTGGLAALGGVGGPVRTLVAGVAGSAADQLTEGTPYNIPATVLATGVAGGIGGAMNKADDVAVAAAARATEINAARKAADAATRSQGVVQSMLSIAANKERKLSDILSLVRVGLSNGTDKSMFNIGNLAKSAAMVGITGMPPVLNVGSMLMRGANMAAQSPAVQQGIRSVVTPTVKSITLEGGQVTDVPNDIQELTPGGQ